MRIEQKVINIKFAGKAGNNLDVKSKQGRVKGNIVCFQIRY
jgi:hypothetical protein